MTWDHAHVERLLAERAIGVLDADDAALAERALVEHVPVCSRCRRALDAYDSLAGDLALAPAPAAPPDSLRRRVMGSARRSARSARSFAFPRRLGVAAAVLAVMALAVSNLLLAGRLDRAEARQALMVEVMGAVGNPDASVVPMRGAPGVRAAMVYVRGSREAYFVASGLPPPRGEYRLWLLADRGSVPLGAFVPQGGIALVRTTAEADGVRRVLVTDELSSGVREPEGRVVVSARVGRS